MNQQPTTYQTLKAAQITSAIALFCCFQIILYAWYSPFAFQYFAGDDMVFIRMQLDGTWPGSFLRALSESTGFAWYRPVYGLIGWLEYEIFGITHKYYFLFNIVLHSLSALTVTFTALRLTQNAVLTSVTIGILFTVSRFASLQLLLAMGSIEGVATLLFCLMLLSCTQSWFVRSVFPAKMAAVFFALAIFTHERYIAAAPFLVLNTFMSARHLRKKSRGLLIVVAICLIVGLNIVVKKYLLGLSFLTGTSAIPIDFDSIRILKFVVHGSLTVLGLNYGPAYLFGLDFMHHGTILWIISILTAGSIMAPIVLASSFWLRNYPHITDEDRRMSGICLCLIVLFVGLLLAASVTFRQELRWLLAPYVVVLFLVAVGVKQLGNLNFTTKAIVAWVLVAGVASQFYYRSFLENIYFWEWQRSVKSLVEVVVKPYIQELDNSTIWLMTPTPGDCEKWSLIIKFYSARRQIETKCIAPSENIPNNLFEGSQLLFENTPATGGKWVDRNIAVSTRFKETIKKAREGDPASQYEVGSMYREGREVSKDQRKALEFLLSAALREHHWAQYWLGRMYLHGEGTEEDFGQALKWFEQSAAAGNVASRLAIASMMIKGQGMKKDIDTGLHLVQQLAIGGYEWAQYLLGDLFANGVDVPHNKCLAMEWFTRAAAQGNQAARERLKAMEK